MNAATRQQRLDHLARATQAKHDAALTRAEAGLRRLIKSGAPVNFRTVAAEAGVSLDFLYRTPQLRERVETLRAQQQPRPAPSSPKPTTPTNAVVATLTAKLRQAREENTHLRAQLAAAHGELLTLRRTPVQSRPETPPVEDTLVTGMSSTS
jgi:hypothetical protein